ncbi:hypothetical protein GUJ93_ZPchr0226g7152 [Zizania palustris]|uniref:Uncharacterized protein n=1 Tax=Zizania palustris TaxID=103762 RepID=A0A8J5RE01_ZIZPA|nr:hypothetical protein GUJ93_ZPchr0226g7152 [Zizania palustris]
MDDIPVLKRPKLHKDEHESASDDSAAKPQPSASPAAEPPPQQQQEDMSEEEMLALVDRCKREVECCKLKLMHYHSLLHTAEKKLTQAQERLTEAQERLTRYLYIKPRDKGLNPSSPEIKALVPMPQPEARPLLVIPETSIRPAPLPEPTPGLNKVSALSSSSPPVLPETVIETQQRENLIQNMKKSPATMLRFHSSTVVSSHHKRKLRCLELCPANDQLVITSALDGIVNLWQVQPKGPSISLLSTTGCFSPKHKWPEDVAWHPNGDTIFAVYSADNDDSQVSVMNRNKRQKKVTFLPAKPHTKGIINNINFMPWSDVCFVTGGSDHAVILWQDKDDSWNHKKVHNELHSSVVMGVAGLQQRNTILSVGSDKRIIAFDLAAERTESKNLIDSKCMSVLPNPRDFNLCMVQTAAPGRQLRLFDIRLWQTEVHAVGWKQESSESQSALISQSWSPDGWYLSSGSADPVIHIFDIRYNGQNPCQSVQAHKKRLGKVTLDLYSVGLESFSE